MIDNNLGLQEVFQIDEIYSLEDYSAYTMISTCAQECKNKQIVNKSEYVRVIFDFNNKEKEIILKKEYAKKIYSFLKIKYNNKNMNILINNNENYQPQMVMNKINSRKSIKGFIYIHLNISVKEFPLKNYILEEINEDIPDYTKTFLLKKKDQNQNTNPNPLYDNRNTNIIKFNPINNQIQTKVITTINNNNSTNLNNNNNSISSNNGINNYNNKNFNNNFQNNQPNNFQNFNNGNINLNNYNNINSLNSNTSPNLGFNQLQNNFNQSNNYNQNQFMNCNGMNLMNNNQNQSFNNNNNYTGSNNMNQNFNNSLNMNSLNQNSMNQNNFNMNSTNQNNFNMNSLNQNSFNMNPMSMNSFNMNPMSMNSMNMNNNNYPMLNQQFQTMPNVNNNMLLNQMNSINMNFNLNNSTPNNNLQNNNKNIQNQNNGDIPNFQLSNIDFEKSEGLFPYVGLRNVGLTCYMNSTLQCLLHIPELNNFFLNVYPNQKDNFDSINKAAETGGKLSKGYSNLIVLVISKNTENRSSKYVTPNCFHNIIGNLNPQFSAYDANDSKDLLLFLIQSMHEELNYFGKKKLKVVPPCDQKIPQKALDFFLEVNNELNLSIFSYLFYGIFESETQCLDCKTKFYNFQYFQILSFPLYKYKSKSKFNLYQGFKDFIKTEKMRGDNQCFCQNCQRLTDSDVNTKIYSTPPYLIINLDYGKNKKYNPDEINFGKSLDLTGFTDEVCTKKSYQLVSISSHMGRSGVSGHYIAYCRNPFQSDDDDIWYEFNDSSVSKVRFEDKNCHSPYFLIFRRID